MGKNYIESSLKRFLKRKIKITLGVVVAFLITGTIGYAEILKPGEYLNKVEDGKIIIEENKDYEYTFKDDVTLKSDKNTSAIYKEYDKNSNLTINVGTNLTIKDTNGNYGINLEGSGTTTINGGNIYIDTNGIDTISYGIFIFKSGDKLVIDSDSLTINGSENDSQAIEIYEGEVDIKLENDFITKTGAGIVINGDGKLTLETIKGDINITATSDNEVSEDGILSYGGYTELTSGGNITVNSKHGSAVNWQGGDIKLQAAEKISLYGEKNGMILSNGNGTLSILGKKIDIIGGTNGIFSDPYNTFDFILGGSSESTTIISGKEAGILLDNSSISLGGDEKDDSLSRIGNVSILSEKIGIKGNDGSTAEIKDFNKLIISGKETGILLDNSNVSLETDPSPYEENSVFIESEKIGVLLSNGGSLEAQYGIDQIGIKGKEYSIYVQEGGRVELEGNKNEIYGNILADGVNSEITIEGHENIISSYDGTQQEKIVAKNGGSIDINLDMGRITGNINDYRNSEDKNFTAGTIKLNLDDRRWENQGTSYVTDVSLRGGSIVFTDKGTGIDINNLTGNGDGFFSMTVDSNNKSAGNMIYVQNSDGGTYQISLQDSDLSNINIGDKIRFATIGYDAQNNGLKFEVLDVKEKGIKDVQFSVSNEIFNIYDPENEIYNSGEKPGNDYVEDKFEYGQNWYLTRVDGDNPDKPGPDNPDPDKPDPDKPNPEDPDNPNVNDIGKTIIEMARANYASAVYMDNLNKRLGDMSFVDGDSGLWVRMRNDRVGEDSEYRLHNYMTQIGYDKTYTLDEGKEYRGAALDYTRGDMKYKNLNGNTEMDRYMFTVYDTRVYNSGVYADYTARAGYMSSDFEVYGRETGNKAEGDYHNLILGAGAEFGKRYDFGETSYFEPQIQLQYTYIDDTDYTTNQNTKVNYDEIHSLIGRAGIRLGHDFYKENSKDNTVYLKADINHEFLGEQDIKAMDSTGSFDVTYENDNTWYDIGIGGAKNLTENFYVYTDIERQFGEAKDNSWQFNLGFRYKFDELKDFTFAAANLFDFDKSVIKPEGKAMIKDASDIMNKRKLKGKLTIEGHTDWTGTNEYNQRLSERRAKAVKDEFEQNLTNENIQCEAKGYGETRPVADNRTKEGRAKNRRVDIKFDKN